MPWFEKYKWYVEVFQGNLNDRIPGASDQAEECRNVHCSDNRRHELWRVPYGMTLRVRNTYAKRHYKLWYQRKAAEKTHEGAVVPYMVKRRSNDSGKNNTKAVREVKKLLSRV